MSNTIRVRAVGDARLPVPGMPGRFVGRAPKTHEPIAEGVEVPDDSYHRRALARGDIAAVPVVKGASAPAKAVQS